MRVSGVPVQIVRKDIKNLHLGVYPPSGRVRVAAPLRVRDEAVRLAVVRKLGWIRKQQARFAAQPRQSKREMVSGESHYFLGRRYRLRVVEHRGAGRVVLRNRAFFELYVRRDTDVKGRERVLQNWYREHLRRLIPPVLAKWEAILGVEAAAWGIKRMKTKWGACSIDARRVWLNLELAKKPAGCLEYIVVHELVHLIERHHNDRFIALMDRHLPQWRQYRHELDAAPLAHADWSY
ncbi:MAG: M48 family metallopeptidase [Candidatus Rokubacteria bacterium]|nr:M48 family metallopeptidase [Candidatus Rokubacteria bacterium]